LTQTSHSLLDAYTIGKCVVHPSKIITEDSVSVKGNQLKIQSEILDVLDIAIVYKRLNQ